MKKWMISIMVIMLLLGDCAKNEETIKNFTNNTTPSQKNKDNDSKIINKEAIVKYSLGQHEGMDIFVDDEYKAHLYIGNEDRIIYENFPNIEEMDPYSILSFTEYMAKWSSDSKYIFINDSIYDIEKDELVPLEDNLVFYWNENKGIYLADGQVIQLGYDGAIFSEFAVGKKLKIFDDGEIRDLKVAKNNEYFVLNPVYVDNNCLQDATIKIPVATLKFQIDELKAKVDEGEHTQWIKEKILDSGILKELDIEYKVVLDKIKTLESYKVLEERTKDNGITENEVNRFFEYLDYDMIFWNTNPSYFYKKIRDEEIIVREYIESEEKSDLDKEQVLQQEMFEKLKVNIEQLGEYKKLKQDVAAYKKLAPVTFENVEVIINMISHD